MLNCCKALEEGVVSGTLHGWAKFVLTRRGVSIVLTTRPNATRFGASRSVLKERTLSLRIEVECSVQRVRRGYGGVREGEPALGRGQFH